MGNLAMPVDRKGAFWLLIYSNEFRRKKLANRRSLNKHHLLGTSA